MNINTARTTVFSVMLLLLVLGYSFSYGVRITSALYSVKTFINQNDAPIAAFSFSTDNSCADLPIQFSNESTGEELSFSWDFGDGSELSTEKDPSHSFINAIGGGTRTFTVTLKVTDITGVSVSQQKAVTVKEIPSLKVTSDREGTDFEDLSFFIVCENQPSEFTFYNAAGLTEKNILYEIEWGDGTPDFSGANWTELKHSYPVGIYTITYSVTPENGCKVSKNYGIYIGSNPAVGLGNPGNTNVCSGEALTFPITGTENNPLGTKYIVTFSDGSPAQVFSHPAPASVTHTFSNTSCGSVADGFANSFSVKIVAENPCSRSQASVVPIYVSEAPLPEIQVLDEPYCVDTDVIIENISELNSEVSTSGNCNSEAKFVWEILPITGWELQGGTTLGSLPNPELPNTWISGSKNIVPRFTTPGTYTIKLTTGNRCGIGEEVKTICVIPKTLPTFILESTEVCGPATIKATNTSTILGSCGETATLTWTISAYDSGTCGPVTSSDWVFASGSNANSESPSFLFKNPGIYTIRLTSTSNCGIFIKEEKITVFAPPSVTISNIPNSCGPLTITPKATVVSCVAGPPSYKWTFEGGIPAASTSLDPGPVTFSTPGPKKIILEVTSSCGTKTSERTFTVSDPPIANAGTGGEICNGEEFQLTGSATGGTGPFTYQWISLPASTFTGSNSATPIVNPSQTTTYKLTVKDQASGCESTDEVEIKVIPSPSIQFDISTQEICSGESTLEVNLSSTPIGEKITWTSEANGVSGVSINGTNQIPIQTLTNKTGKPVDVIYTAIISNPSQGNCSVIPSKYIIRVNPEPIYTEEKISICSDQLFDFKPINNIEGSTFSWTVSAPAGITGAANSPEAKTSINMQLQNTTNTPKEVYYSITPFLGLCQGNTFQLAVSVQPSPSLDFSEADQILCTGSSSNPVRFSSDVPGATFTWTADPSGVTGVIESGAGNEIPAQILENKTSQPIIVEYKISVITNSGGTCSGIPKTYRITVNPPISLNDEVSDFSGFGISCTLANNGFIKLNPTGGNGIYSYSWTGPASFTSKSKDLENLRPGSYQVNVTDQFGCSISKSYQITEPQPVIASLVSTTNILCAGDESGAIEISVSGGINSLPYQFEWRRNGIAFPAITQNLSDVPAGNYEVRISDANGCFKILTGIRLTEPPVALVINFQKTNISCFGANDGALDLDVSGGTPPYVINWSFGSAQSSFDNLGPGNYTLSVSDQSGCIRTQTITIEDAPLFRTVPDVKQISCFGEKDGSIKLNLQGGVGGTTIRWDHGAEVENLFNLEAGFYGVTIKDQTDCELRSEFNIVEPALLELEGLLTDALDCINPQSGSIDLRISGGTPPYSIKWSNGETSEDLLGITSGQYAVSIADASGCTINQVFEVKRPPALSITTFQTSNVQCEPRFIEKEIKIAIAGGFAPYTIEWSGGNISSDFRTMKATTPGLYEVVVTDGKGCVARQSYEIENLEVIPEAEIQSAAFEQYNAYLVNFEIQFVNRSFGQITSYNWDFGDGTKSMEENPRHTYTAPREYEITLTVSDIYGCTSELRKKINVIDYFLVVPNVFTPNGDGINEYFFPKFINIESLKFWILNKWGETIYYTDDINSQGWDGTIDQEIGIPGNYVYRLEFKTLDGRKQIQTDQFMLLK